MTDDESRVKLTVVACFKGFPDIIEVEDAPHLTLVPVAYVRLDQVANIFPRFKNIIFSIPKFEVEITEWDLLGKNSSTHVWRVYGIFKDGVYTSIEGLHHRLIKEFAHLGIDVNANFNGDQFIPHITDKQAHFRKGNVFQVNKILVLRKLPLGNYELLFEKVLEEGSNDKHCNGLVT